MVDYSKYGIDHEPLFVHVGILFADEINDPEQTMYTYIKTNEEIDAEDERIFFYGLSLEEIEYGYENNIPFEDEWFVVDIDYVTDVL